MNQFFLTSELAADIDIFLNDLHQWVKSREDVEEKDVKLVNDTVNFYDRLAEGGGWQNNKLFLQQSEIQNLANKFKSIVERFDVGIEGEEILRKLDAEAQKSERDILTNSSFSDQYMREQLSSISSKIRNTLGTSVFDENQKMAAGRINNRIGHSLAFQSGSGTYKSMGYDPGRNSLSLRSQGKWLSGHFNSGMCMDCEVEPDSRSRMAVLEKAKRRKLYEEKMPQRNPIYYQRLKDERNSGRMFEKIPPEVYSDPIPPMEGGGGGPSGPSGGPSGPFGPSQFPGFGPTNPNGPVITLEKKIPQEIPPGETYTFTGNRGSSGNDETIIVNGIPPSGGSNLPPKLYDPRTGPPEPRTGLPEPQNSRVDISKINNVIQNAMGALGVNDKKRKLLNGDLSEFTNGGILGKKNKTGADNTVKPSIINSKVSTTIEKPGNIK